MYKVEFKDYENGVIIKTEQKTFKKLIEWTKDHIINGDYTLSMCKVKIERVHPSGARDIIADGDARELLDIIKVADGGA